MELKNWKFPQFWVSVMLHLMILTYIPSYDAIDHASSTLSEFHQLEQKYTEYYHQKMKNIMSEIKKKHPNPSDYAVALSTKVVTYGGYGNFIGSLVTATMVSLLSNRHLVINNAVVRSMFMHPDTSFSFNPFDIIPQTPMYCASSCSFLSSQMRGTHKLVGVNRCDQAFIRDPAVLDWYASTFQVPNTFQKSPSNWLLTENRLSYDIIHWLLSKPTPSWDLHMKQRATSVYANCSHGGVTPHRANLGLQIRTFADVGHQSSAFFERCYIDCTKNVSSYLHEIHKHPICVLVTSDNSHLTDRVIDELSTVPYITAVHNDYPHGATLSHSAGLLLEHREDPNFNIASISDHPEFVDWMLLSDSETSVYTHGSTFAGSARHRAGIFRAKDDHVVRVTGTSCTCDPVVDPSTSPELFTIPK